MSTAPRDPFLSALVLAGTIAGDPEVTGAALDPRLATRLAEALGEHAALRTRDREAALRELIAALAPRAPESAEAAPARVRSVLAPLAARERAAAWQRDALVPRKGFRASGALRVTLASQAEEDAWRA
ncbi:MAG: hypothetical protein U0234_13520 [Sandaracinus sp.]